MIISSKVGTRLLIGLLAVGETLALSSRAIQSISFSEYTSSISGRSKLSSLNSFSFQPIISRKGKTLNTSTSALKLIPSSQTDTFASYANCKYNTFYTRNKTLIIRGGGINSSSILMAGKSNEKEDKMQTNEKKWDVKQSIGLIVPLLLVYISNQWSRSSIYYLVDFSDNATPKNAMNVALQFSEAQYGALASVAFTALFAIASLLAGNLADKFDRKLLTSASCFAWSIATLATATATGYTQVLIARIAMGLACAFATPSAYTLIKDLMPPNRTALASSIYGTGVYFGGALASLSILLDQRFGWSQALIIIAAFGAASSALSAVFLPQDPSNTDTDTPTSNTNSMNEQEGSSSSSNSLISDTLSIVSTSQIKLLFLAAFVRFSAGLSIAVWSAPYFRLAFPLSSSSYALVNAFIVSICGVTSGVVGGALADYLGSKAIESNKEENAGRMIVPICGSLLAVPAWYMCMHSTTFSGAMIWLAIEYIVAECWFGPVVAVLQSSVGEGKGGTAQGLFTLMGAIGNLAPSLLGILYGMQNSLPNAQNDLVLSNLLSIFVCGGYFLSAIFFALSVQSSSKDDTLKQA